MMNTLKTSERTYLACRFLQSQYVSEVQNSFEYEVNPY
uniref:Uncharacterized protein n=1 Tax=Anguilla anguilla TaxID=7936 RepID=A0A0E9PMA9_ANGAN